jgi:hypothetical protein
MIWCGNGNGIDGPVLEKLADIDVGLGLAVPFSAVLLQDVFVHVTNSGNFHVRHV